MLTPDAQLITALGGTTEVDPDAHIRAFKHTHTGTPLPCNTVPSDSSVLMTSMMHQSAASLTDETQKLASIFAKQEHVCIRRAVLHPEGIFPNNSIFSRFLS